MKRLGDSSHEYRAYDGGDKTAACVCTDVPSERGEKGRQIVSERNGFRRCTHIQPPCQHGFPVDGRSQRAGSMAVVLDCATKAHGSAKGTPRMRHGRDIDITGTAPPVPIDWPPVFRKPGRSWRELLFVRDKSKGLLC